MEWVGRPWRRPHKLVIKLSTALLEVPMTDPTEATRATSLLTAWWWHIRGWQDGMWAFHAFCFPHASSWALWEGVCVCVCVSFPWLTSHISPLLVLGNPARFLPLTTSPSAKQNNIFEMGCLSGQHTASAAHRGPSFKGIAEWDSPDESPNCVCLTWFTGNGQLIRRTGLRKPVGRGDKCLCSSVVPTGLFAWGLEHKGGSDKGPWNPCLAQGAQTAQEIDI